MPGLEERYLAAKDRIIRGDFKFLNEAQQEAVMTTEGALLILAGAGSGKTTVLISRIVNLIRYGRASDSDEIPCGITEDDVAFLEAFADGCDDDGYDRAVDLVALDPVDPWRIIAITFTNKAADELKNRLDRSLGPRALDVWALTFHSACVRILRRDIEKLGYDRSFTIYDTADSRSVMKKILKRLDLDDKTYPVQSVLSQISRAKDARVGAREYFERADSAGDIRKRNVGRAYIEYEDALKNANALDFDDLILKTVELLLTHQEVGEYYRRRFRYILVDEYQDTNRLQYMLVSLLAGREGNICVVGDDDQSIYKFRGATIENILNFEEKYENAKVIRLEQNYRSKNNILEAANAVIKNNSMRKGKKLWSDREQGEKLTLHVAQSEREEAQFIAGEIIRSVEGGARWQDHAVLYRINALSNQLEFAFKQNGIPHKVIGGARFFERAEIKDILSYLCAVNNPDDDLRLLRIINVPARGIGGTTVGLVQDVASKNGVSIFSVINNVRRYPELDRAGAKLARFADIINELRFSDLPLDQFYDALLDKSNYVRALKEKDDPQNVARIENVLELRSNIVAYMSENEEATLAGFLDEIALYTDMEEFDANADSVVLMTIHSAKGLEFPTVFLAGAEEGIFPGSRSIGEREEMEEERRLCYVAITRAREKLYITCAKRRMLFGRTTAGMESRFIEEIPEQNIEKNISRSRYNFGGDEDLNIEWTQAEPARAPKRKISNSAPKKAELPEIKTGDNVEHRAFGSGVVLKVVPAGGDAMLEIDFAGIGLKRLMLKTASAFMDIIK